MIDITEKEYEIDIRKNSSIEQSTILNKMNIKHNGYMYFFRDGYKGLLSKIKGHIFKKDKANC
jgi:hypothetical protein